MISFELIYECVGYLVRATKNFGSTAGLQEVLRAGPTTITTSSSCFGFAFLSI